MQRVKKYTTYVKVMLTDMQKKKVEDEARKMGLTESDIIRLLINKIDDSQT